jgi:hypothetical protein
MSMGFKKVTVMSTKGRGFVLAAAILGSVLIGAAPVLAQSHGGGGGGHAGGGGGHAGGGGHFGGGGHAAGGGGHFNGGGAHFGGAGHFAAGGARGYAGGGFAHGYPAGFHGGGYAAHGGYGHGGGYYGHGYSTGAYWRGGYWRGGFWPRAYYGLGFSWFLPVLPLAYATYWYGDIPYYYANDVYYTYNQGYDGYVATDPPPVADSSGAEGSAGAAPNAAPGQVAPESGDQGAAGTGQIFMYPKNGQSVEQQATDKAQCQQWAQQQAGQVAQNGSDYMRAMAACVEGRGYSAR